MNVANKELCAELHKLSGWGATEWKWCNTAKIGDFLFRVDHPNWKPEYYVTEAYDLGYLRKKIYGRTPATATDVVERDFMEALFLGEDDTVRFAIELFKQGILKKEANND